MNSFSEMLRIDKNCKNLKNLPKIQIVVNARSYYDNIDEIVTKELVLNPEDYIIDGQRINKVAQEENYDVENFTEECLPALMGLEVPAPRGPIFIFGEYFLKKYYTVFDRDQNVLGISLSDQNIDDKSKVSKRINVPYTDNDKISYLDNQNQESRNLYNKYEEEVNP